MSERGLGPLPCLITDLLAYLFLYVGLFSGDSSSTGNTVFFLLKFGAEEFDLAGVRIEKASVC